MDITNNLLSQIMRNLNFGSGSIQNLLGSMPRGFSIGGLLGGTGSGDYTGFNSNGNIFDAYSQMSQTGFRGSSFENAWRTSPLGINSTGFFNKNSNYGNILSQTGMGKLPDWYNDPNCQKTGVFASTTVQPKVVAEKEVPSGSTHKGYSFTMYDTGYIQFFDPKGKEISLAEFKQAVDSDWDNYYVDAINSHLPEEREKLKKDSEKNKTTISSVVKNQPAGIDQSHINYSYSVDSTGTVKYYNGSSEVGQQYFQNLVGNDWEKFKEAINQELTKKGKPELS